MKMVLKSIVQDNKSNSLAEFCLDEILSERQAQKMTLEQKIEQIFKQFRKPIYRYLVVTFWNRSEAEDIAQETFIRLYN